MKVRNINMMLFFAASLFVSPTVYASKIDSLWDLQLSDLREMKEIEYRYPNQEGMTEEPKVFDLQVYSDDVISVTLNKIEADGITFTYTNLSDKRIDVGVDYVSLDGLHVLGSPLVCEVPAGRSDTMKTDASINNTNHAKLIASGRYNTTDEDFYVSFCSGNIDLSGEYSQDYEVPKGTPDYSSENLDLFFIGYYEDGIAFFAANKHEDAILEVLLDYTYIDNERKDIFTSFPLLPGSGDYLCHNINLFAFDEDEKLIIENPEEIFTNIEVSIDDETLEEFDLTITKQ